MKRIFLSTLVIVTALSASAQSPLTFGGRPAFRSFQTLSDTNALKSKWSLSKYVGMSAGFSRFGNFYSVPVGLQLNRKLTDNIYAFAGVSLAPTLTQFNNAFFQPKMGLGNVNHFGMMSTAELGLMYVNPERTFSISGSIGVSRGTYDGYWPLYVPANSQRFPQGKAY